MNKFDKAFQFFDRAQKFCETNNLVEYAGITYLNISSITSQQGNHTYSLQYATASLRQFENQFKALQNDVKNQYNTDLLREKSKYIGISYYNIAVEHEYLKNYP